MIWHALRALSAVADLSEILLIGVYEDAVFTDFLRSARREFPNVTVNYLREYRPLGTAGGLYHFRDSILKGSPKQFFLLNADVGSSFPLGELGRFHANHRGVGTLLVKQVPPAREGPAVNLYGSVVVEPSSSGSGSSKGGLAVHYVEKPESFVSDRINAGIYLFSTEIFGEIKRAMDDKARQAAEDPLADAAEIVHLEHDVLPLLASAHKLFALETADFWLQIKSAGSALAASSAYLEHFVKHSPELLTPASPFRRASTVAPPPTDEKRTGPEIVGAVYIHPDATVDPSAKIGPNVAIGPNTVVEAGARVANSILLDGVQVGRHACVVWSIVGGDCKMFVVFPCCCSSAYDEKSNSNQRLTQTPIAPPSSLPAVARRPHSTVVPGLASRASQSSPSRARSSRKSSSRSSVRPRLPRFLYSI